MSIVTPYYDHKAGRVWAILAIFSVILCSGGIYLMSLSKWWSILLGTSLILLTTSLFIAAVKVPFELKLASLPKGTYLFKIRMWLILKAARARHGMVRGFKNRAEMRHVFHPEVLYKNCNDIRVKGISLNDFVDVDVRHDVKAAIEANNNPNRFFSFYLLDTRNFMGVDFLKIREIDELKQGQLAMEVWTTKFALHEIKKKPKLVGRIEMYSYLTYPTESLAVFDKLLLLGPYCFNMVGPGSPFIVADATSEQFSPFVDTFASLESQKRSRPIDKLVCLVGNLTVDELIWEDQVSSDRSGGSVLYAGLALAKLNCDVVVIGNGDKKSIDLLREAGICVLWTNEVDKVNTTRFENYYTNGKRQQKAKKGPKVIRPHPDLTKHWQAFDAIMFLPVLEEVDCVDFFEAFGEIPSILDAQGFVRRVQNADQFAKVVTNEPRYSPLKVLRKGNLIWRGDVSEGKAWTGKQDPKDICRVLLKDGAKEVIITNGPLGCCACDGKRFYQIDDPGKVDKDPTGAGDVFDACYLFALLTDMSITERLKFATAASFLMVTADWDEADPLAKFPTLAQIEGRMEQIQDPEFSELQTND